MAIVRTAADQGRIESMRCAHAGLGTSAAANSSRSSSVRRRLRSAIVVTLEICRAERSRGYVDRFGQRRVA